MKGVILFISLLIASPCFGWGILQMSGAQVATDTPSPLYQSATSVWDFDGDGADEKSLHTLTGVNVPTYDTGDYQQGTSSAVLDRGLSQSFTTPDSDALDLTGDYTLAFWMKLDTVANNVIVRKSADGGGYYVPIIYEGDANYLLVQHEASWTATRAVSTWTPSVGVWYHVCITYATNNITYYVSQSTFGDIKNGETVAQTTTPAASSAAFVIGNHASLYFDGRIDEFALWDGTAISGTDAETIFLKTWR